jgi:hypothetical protein
VTAWKDKQLLKPNNMEIEIKNTDAKQVAIPSKLPMYVCVYWNHNGTMWANTPSEDKRYQENYAFSMAKHAAHIAIYKFEIDVPL